MASIEKLANSRWKVRYRTPDHRQRARTFARKVDATLFAASAEADKARGNWADPQRGRITVVEWAESWRATKVDLRPSSLARLDSTLRSHVLPAFGPRPLQSIGNADVRSWVARMTAAGLSPSTVRKAAHVLSQLLKAAVSDRRLAVNPATDVPLPVEQYGDQRFLTAGEVTTLANAIDPRFRVLVLVAAYGGLRFGELAALRRSQVDVLRGRVMVTETLVDVNGELTFGPPKTKHGRRTVPLPRRISAELAQHLDAHTAPDPDVLVFTLQGRPLRRGSFRSHFWLPAVQKAGLEGLRFHDLRHTFVSLWVDAGVNVKEVSVRAGHSSVAFTLDRYGHLYEDADDAISDRLDALLGDAATVPDAVVRRLRP